jgi:hypothetical protein
MDPTSLYREEVYTDRRMGVIRVLTPVTADGAFDASRKVLYSGEAQILTPAGALPIGFEIEANTLAEAVEGFAAAAQAGVERTVRQLQDMRREASSQIVIPDIGGGPGPRGPMPGGRGKLHLP